MKKPHDVTILNQRLVIRSDASNAAVTEIASFVSGRIQEVLEKTKSASMLTAALLTCLNMADELKQAQGLKGASSARVAQKVRDIIQLIDAHLDQGRQMAL